MFAERCQEVRAKINQLIAEYEHRHPGQKVPACDIRFDLRGRSAGQAGRREFQYFMRFNRDMMLNAGWDHLITDTVPHELAHIICFANGSDQAHGLFWKRTCQELGGTGERCHSEAVTYAKGRTYVYTSSTGYTVNLSEVKHRRIQAGSSYSFRDRSRGRLDRTCAYSLLGSTTVSKPAAPTRAVPVETLLPKPTAYPVGQPYVTATGTSKAELVRTIIRAVKEQNGTPQQAQQRARAELGLTANYARNCVTFNWNRV